MTSISDSELKVLKEFILMPPNNMIFGWYRYIKYGDYLLLSDKCINDCPPALRGRQFFLHKIVSDLLKKRYELQLTRDEWISTKPDNVLCEYNFHFDMILVYDNNNQFLECLLKIDNGVFKYATILNILSGSDENWYISNNSIWTRDKKVKVFLDFLFV
mgnify:CR=1 FL=1